MASKSEVRRIRLYLNGKEIADSQKTINAAVRKGRNELALLTKGTDKYEAKLKEVQALQKRQKEYQEDLKGTRKGLDKVRSSLGGVKAAMLGAFSVVAIMSAVKALIQFQQGLERTRRKVQQLSGATGDALDNITAKAQTIATAFDQDVNEVLLSAKNLSENLGISMEASLDKMLLGFAAGADGSGELLDQLKEYGPFMREAGVSADQFIAIIKQEVDQGIYSDKGIDAIKEAHIRLREMPKATQEALKAIGIDGAKMQAELRSGTTTVFDSIQQVSAKLDTLPPQSREVGQAIADIFGGPGEDAGLKFLTTLKDINAETGISTEELTEYQQVQLEVLEKNEQWALMMNRLFGQADGLFNLLIARGKVWLIDFVMNAINGTIDLINNFIGLYNESEAFRQTVQALGATFQSIYRVWQGVYDQFLIGFRTLGRVAAAAFKGDFGSIPEILAEAGNQVVDTAYQMGKDVVANYQRGFDEARQQSNLQKVNFDLSGSETSTGGLAAGLGVSSGGGTEDAAKKEEERQQLLDEEQAFKDEMHLLQMTAEEREIADTQAKYERLMEMADRHGEDTAGLQEMQDQEILAIRQKHYLEAQKAQDAATKKSLEAKKAENEAKRKMLSDYSNMFLDALYLMGTQQSSLAGFMKAATLAQLIADTASAIGSLTRASSANPANSVTAGAAGAAQFVAGLAKITANIAQAKQTLSGANTPPPPGRVGFALGGYTGEGDTRQIAGAVHRDEHVTPSPVLNTPDGAMMVEALENIRNGNAAQGGMMGSLLKALNEKMERLIATTEEAGSKPAILSQDMLREEQALLTELEVSSGNTGASYFD